MPSLPSWDLTQRHFAFIVPPMNKSTPAKAAPMRPTGTSTRQPAAPTGTGQKYGASKTLSNPVNDRHAKGMRPK